LTLQSQMFRARAMERAGRFEESYRAYDSTLKVWIPIGGSTHPFTLMLKTGFGSVCRQLKRFLEAEKVFLEAFADRERLYTLEDVTSIDSVLQLAALYYDSARGEEGIGYLDLIAPLKGLEVEFERRCQEQHIRALIQFSQDYFNKPVASLRSLLDEVSDEGRDKNNRELLWARITLTDALRQSGRNDEALMLFSGLVTSRKSGKSTGAATPTAVDDHDSSALDDEPESPAQLAIAEEALRLLKDDKFDEADELLQDSKLKWRRQKDFWVLSGGPITDTAPICGLPTTLIDYHVVDMPKNLVTEIPLLRSGQDQYPEKEKLRGSHQRVENRGVCAHIRTTGPATLCAEEPCSNMVGG
jgi:tetratricopeptide (TPR) repeat protein